MTTYWLFRLIINKRNLACLDELVSNKRMINHETSSFMKNESQNHKTYVILAKINQKTAENSGIMMNNRKHLDVTNGPPYRIDQI